MKRTILIILTLISVQWTYSQVDTISTIEAVHTAGMKMMNSFYEGDYNTFLDLTHSKIIEMSGGREKMKEMFKDGLGEDVKFLDVILNKPDKIIVKDSIIQCSLEQRQEIEMDGKKFYIIGTLIGISYDLGKTWQFIGVANNTLSNLKEFFPELDDDLEIKEQTLPILIE
jgi:hypothetical protein